jgi:hypothetical protein
VFVVEVLPSSDWETVEGSGQATGTVETDWLPWWVSVMQEL